MIIMEFVRNIVIVGSEDGCPSRFVTKIEPMKLRVECEMAITSLHHGAIFPNIQYS